MYKHISDSSTITTCLKMKMKAPIHRYLILLIFSLFLCLSVFYFILAYPSGSYLVSFIVSPSIKDNITPEKFKLNSTTGAYELDGKPIIWQYWNTPQMPLYIRLLIEALHCRNPEFRIIVVHQSDVYQYLPDLQVSKDIFTLLHPPHQADLFRIAVLLKYGGVYTDIDVYPLDKLYPLYQLLTDSHLIIGDWGKYDLAFGGMGPSRANVSLFRVWHSQQLSKLHSIFPHGNDKNLTEDPLGWTSILYDAEKGIDVEIESGRTTLIRYNGPLTNNQLIDKGYQHASHTLWSQTSHRFLPLNWSPFLFVWGYKMKDLFSNMTKISQLMPDEETIYSSFVGCALLDCWQEYNQLKAEGKQKTPTAQLDVDEAMEALQRVNRSICNDIRMKPIFELDKYKL